MPPGHSSSECSSDLKWRSAVEGECEGEQDFERERAGDRNSGARDEGRLVMNGIQKEQHGDDRHLTWGP